MRTIKFRGKRIINDDWIYGDLFREIALTPTGRKRKSEYNGFWAIQAETSDGIKSYSVDTKTIGQFTSLFDINGKEIYEGDILALAGVETERLEVRFVRGVFAFLWNGNLEEECPLDAPTHCCVEVIGNIHDNPKLLEGGTQ